jgi:hypothetical protein
LVVVIALSSLRKHDDAMAAASLSNAAGATVLAGIKDKGAARLACGHP